MSESDPIRWREMPELPPGTLELLESVERPDVLPPAIRAEVGGRLSAQVVRPAPRWMAGALPVGVAVLATAAVIGGIVVWHQSRPRAPERIDPLVEEMAAPSEAPSSTIDAVEEEHTLGQTIEEPPEVERVVAPPSPMRATQSAMRAVPQSPDVDPVPAMTLLGREAFERELPSRMEARPAVAEGVGTLMVNSMPWSRVWVDGRSLGNTPVVNVRLAAGTHRLRLQAEGFDAVTRTIQIRADQRSQFIHRFSRSTMTSSIVDPFGDPVPANPF